MPTAAKKRRELEKKNIQIPGTSIKPDALYDCGGTFPLKWFLNDGTLNPKPSDCLSCFEKRRNCIIWPWDYSSGCNLIFAQLTFG